MPDAPAFAVSECAGTVVEAVQQQLDGLGVAPGLAATALAMARLLDNPVALPQHPAAARCLVEILGKAAKGTQRRGRLAAVRSMTDGSA